VSGGGCTAVHLANDVREELEPLEVSQSLPELLGPSLHCIAREPGLHAFWLEGQEDPFATVLDGGKSLHVMGKARQAHAEGDLGVHGLCRRLESGEADLGHQFAEAVHEHDALDRLLPSETRGEASGRRRAAPVNPLRCPAYARQDRDEVGATYSIRRVLHLLSEMYTVFNTRDRRSCWAATRRRRVA
jgi:hypothetical protein